MNKKVKGIFAGASVLVLLSGALVALKLTDNNDSDLSSSSTSGTEAVEKGIITEWMNKNGKDIIDGGYTEKNISSISIKNKSDEYSVKCGKAEDGTVKCTIDGMENVPLNSSVLNSLPKNIVDSSVVQNVSQGVSDVSKYGLSDPASKVSFTLDDGNKVTVLIGNTSPIDTETYFMFEGGDSVYTMYTSRITPFISDKNYYVSLELLPALEKGDKLNVKKMVVDRQDLDYDMVYEYQNSQSSETGKSGVTSKHIMTEPVFAYTNAEKADTVIKGMFGLKADAIVQLNPDKDTLSKVGMDNPFCTVSMQTTEGKSYTFKISKISDATSQTGEGYFGYLEGTNVLYAFKEAKSLPWVSYSTGDILSQIIIGSYIYDVENLTIEAKGKDKLSFTGSGTEDNFSVTRNGKSCSMDRFRDFYLFLLNMPAEEFSMEEPKGEPIAKVTMKVKGSDKDDVIEFYNADSRKVLITRNGKPCFKCRASFVTVLMENMGKFDTDEKFTTEW